MFYVENVIKIERGASRLVINYKPLNNTLKCIRYHIPNKRDLLNILYETKVSSNFDMNRWYWQIQIAKEDRCKTVFTVPFKHFE